MNKGHTTKQSRPGTRFRVALVWTVVLASGLGGTACNKEEASKKQGALKVEWNITGQERTTEGPRSRGGGVLGFLGGGGEDLWREGCVHAIEVMKKAVLKDMEADLATASPDEKRRIEDTKRDMEKELDRAVDGCLEEFRKHDEDSADEAARCILKAEDQRAIEVCARGMRDSNKQEGKKEEKKEEKKKEEKK